MKKQTANQILISNTQSDADIHHLCGVAPPEAALFIRTGAAAGTLIVSEMEYNRFRRTVKNGIHVVHPELIGSTWKAGAVDWIAKLAAGKSLILPYHFPAGVTKKLCAGGWNFTVADPGSLCPQREIKTAGEIRAIQKSQRAAVAAMNAAVKQIAAASIDKTGKIIWNKKPLTSEIVRRTITKTLLDHDCIAHETIVAGGKQSADPHERGHGPLRAGEPIVIDIFPRSAETGYWGDITRTVCRGAAPAALKKMYAAVKAAQTAALAGVRAGAWTDKLHNAAAGEMLRRGFRTGTENGTPQGFIHGLGHGVGLEIHEAPRVSSAVHQKLRAGQIITIEPGLYYPALGGIRIEDTVAVTKDGYQMLAACSKKFEI